ncbi:Calcium-dependent protein kinase 10 [Bienertia sinuspersici]
MGNCNGCMKAEEAVRKESPKTKKKAKGKGKANPYARNEGEGQPAPVRVLKDIIPAVGPRISDKYVIGRELGRGEFGVTYLCTDRESKDRLAVNQSQKGS